MSTDRRRPSPAPPVSVRVLPLLAFAFTMTGTAVLIAGCPGSLENKDQFVNGACGDVPNKLLGTRCAKSNCHDSETASNDLDLTPNAGLVDRIVDVDAMACNGKLIDSAAPDASLIYTKCLVDNGCGSRMPLTGDKLTAQEESCLLEWVQSVASPSGSGGGTTAGGGGGTTTGGGGGGGSSTTTM